MESKIELKKIMFARVSKHFEHFRAYFRFMFKSYL